MTPPWAHTAQNARLFVIDARGALPLSLWLIHWAYFTMFIALGSILVLAIFERRGLGLAAAFYLIRAKLAGPERDVIPLRRFRERCRF
jgi:intracellular multiplication protein IcmT